MVSWMAGQANDELMLATLTVPMHWQCVELQDLPQQWFVASIQRTVHVY